MYRVILAAGFAAVATPVAAQQHDGQAWLQVNTNVPLAGKVRVTLEQIARWSDRQEGLYQTEFGGLLAYRAAEGVEIGVGYRKVGFHSANPGADEDRLRHMAAELGLEKMRPARGSTMPASLRTYEDSPNDAAISAPLTRFDPLSTFAALFRHVLDELSIYLPEHNNAETVYGRGGKFCWAFGLYYNWHVDGQHPLPDRKTIKRIKERFGFEGEPMWYPGAGDLWWRRADSDEVLAWSTIP